MIFWAFAQDPEGNTSALSLLPRPDDAFCPLITLILAVFMRPDPCCTVCTKTALCFWDFSGKIYLCYYTWGGEPPYKTLCIPPAGLDLYISFRILYQTMTSLLIVSRWGRGGVFVAFSAPRPRPDWFMLRLQPIIQKGARCHVDGAFGHPLATDFPGSRSSFCRFLRPPSLICFSFLSACSFFWLAWHHSEPPSVGHNRTEVFSLSLSLFTLFSPTQWKKEKEGEGRGGRRGILDYGVE